MKKFILIITLLLLIFPLKCLSGGPISGGPIGYGGVDMGAPGDIGETTPGNATFQDTITLRDAIDIHILKAVQEPGLGGRLTFGLDETARTMIICDAGDVDVDFGLATLGEPCLNIYPSAAAGNYLILNYMGVYANGYASSALTLKANEKIVFQLNNNNNSEAGSYVFQTYGSYGLTDTNAEQSFLLLKPQVNQSATAAYNGLKIKVTETVLGDASTGDGGGTNNLILAGTSTDPDMFKVDNVGRICLAESSDPAALADHVFFYGKDVAGTGEAFAADAAANAAQLTPHNFTLFEPDATEAYPWSYYAENKALGIKINVDMAGMIRAVEGLTGKTFIYTQNIAKEVDLEKVYKDKWIVDYIKVGIQETELTKDQALETVQVDTDKWYEVETVDPKTGEVTVIKKRNKLGEEITGYEFVDDEVKPKIKIIWETEKINKSQTKENVKFNETDGKFYMTTKPTRAQAITAAETGFMFTPPKWLGDRLNK